VYKVITLTCNRFASYSDEDGTVKLYSSEIYEQIEIPFEQQIAPNSLIQLKRQREVLVISSVMDISIFINFVTLINCLEQLT
jgi:hypothetical protein